jgi:tetratricopeptide (TPR) repeat protein
MAAQGRTLAPRSTTALSAYWLVAGLAAALSLAAALLALLAPAGGSPASHGPSPAEQAAALNDRIAFFEARVSEDAFNVVALNQLAGDYYQRARQTGDIGDYNRADMAATRAVAVLPDFYNSVVAAALTKNALHDFAASLAFAQHAVELRPGQGAGFALRGDDYVALGRYQEAAADYQKAVELEPGLAAFSRLATISFLRGDTRNAEDFWKQAIASSASQPAENGVYVRVQLAQLYFDRGDLSAAEAQVKRALAAYPGYVHALALSARIDAARGRFDAAIATYPGVVQRQPLLEYVIALGETYQAAGRQAEAEQQFALVDAIDRLYRSNGVNTDLALSVFYSSHDRNLEQALAMAESAYEAAPGVYAADAVAWAMLKNGRPADAVPYSDEALRLGTPDALLLYHAGMVRLANGDNAGATALLESVMRLNPHFSPQQAPIAARALADLRAGKAAR